MPSLVPLACAPAGALAALAPAARGGPLTVTSREKRAPRAGHTGLTRDTVPGATQAKTGSQKYFGIILFLQSRGCKLYMRRAHTVLGEPVVDILRVYKI